MNNRYDDLSKGMKIFKEELKKDRYNNSLYYAWQSNLAVTIMDNSNLGYEKSNEIAHIFLKKFIGDSKS